MKAEKSEIIILRTTIGLLSSMVYSGKQHSKESENKVRIAIKALESLSEHSALKEQEVVGYLCEKRDLNKQFTTNIAAANTYKDRGYTVTELVKK